jgi:hypothetical protein
MSIGPRLVSGWRHWVLVIGAICEHGGAIILREAFWLAGWWAVEIGSSMVFFEISAMIGATLVAEGARTDA